MDKIFEWQKKTFHRTFISLECWNQVVLFHSLSRRILQKRKIQMWLRECETYLDKMKILRQFAITPAPPAIIVITAMIFANWNSMSISAQKGKIHQRYLPKASLETLKPVTLNKPPQYKVSALIILFETKF